MNVIETLFMGMLTTSDNGLRSLLCSRLQEWIEGLEPSCSYCQAMKALRQVRATPLEPFNLSRAQIEAGALFLQAAFSKRISMTHARIIGPDTIGLQGGAVFTSDLCSYYAVRYAFGRCRCVPQSGWLLVPGLYSKRPYKGNIQSVECFVNVTERGINISFFGLASADIFLSSAISTSTVIENRLSDRYALHWKAEGSNAELSLQPKTSEHSIRLIALCSQKADLILTTKQDKTVAFLSFSLRFPSQEGKPEPLSAQSGFVASVDSIQCPLPDGSPLPEFSHAEKRRIAREVAVPLNGCRSCPGF